MGTFKMLSIEWIYTPAACFKETSSKTSIPGFKFEKLRLKIPKYSYFQKKYRIAGLITHRRWSGRMKRFILHESIYSGRMFWGNKHQYINNSFTLLENLVLMYQNIVSYMNTLPILNSKISHLATHLTDHLVFRFFVILVSRALLMLRHSWGLWEIISFWRIIFIVKNFISW